MNEGSRQHPFLARAAAALERQSARRPWRCATREKRTFKSADCLSRLPPRHCSARRAPACRRSRRCAPSQSASSCGCELRGGSGAGQGRRTHPSTSTARFVRAPSAVAPAALDTPSYHPGAQAAADTVADQDLVIDGADLSNVRGARQMRGGAGPAVAAAAAARGGPQGRGALLPKDPGTAAPRLPAALPSKPGPHPPPAPRDSGDRR
jgi:hypothetical protein